MTHRNLNNVKLQLRGNIKEFVRKLFLFLPHLLYFLRGRILNKTRLYQILKLKPIVRFQIQLNIFSPNELYFVYVEECKSYIQYDSVKVFE